jgi:hypothetical protein
MISAAPWMGVTIAVVLGLLVQWKGRRLLLKGVTGQIDRLAERAGLTVSLWVSPLIDTLSVIWIATERFLWQGLTLWLPRRVLLWAGMHVDWLQRVPLPSIRHVPLAFVSVGAGFLHRVVAAPRTVIVLLAVFVVAMWVFAGVIP